MTHDEFIFNAINPACKADPVVYLLSIDILNYDEEENAEPYGNASLSKECKTAYFLEFDLAEKEIWKIVDNDPDAGIYRFMIREIPLGIVDEKGAYQRKWIYDARGELTFIDYWSTMERDFLRFDRFYGQPEERQRFKVGAVVEFTDYNDVLQVGIVERIPEKPEEVWQRNKDEKNRCDVPYYDGSDCNYIVWYGPGKNDWDYMWDDNLMPPSAPDSPKITELKEAYRQYNANSK